MGKESGLPVTARELSQAVMLGTDIIRVQVTGVPGIKMRKERGMGGRGHRGIRQ